MEVGRMFSRKLEETFFRTLMILSTAIIVGSLFLILSTIIAKGYNAFSLDMITSVPSGGFYFGKDGGVLNAIIGSLYIAGGASIIGMAVSIPVVIYLNVYIRRDSFGGTVSTLGHDILFGVPSIIYGALGFMVMVFLGMKESLLGGILTVSLLVIPIMVCTMNEVLRTLPHELLDASFSVGATRLETSKVVIRQVLPGISTAFLLAFGRAIGDAASVLFTAGYSDNIPTHPGQPAATLPLAIFFQLTSPIREVQERAFAAALILTIIVLAISTVARLLKRKFSRYVI